MANNTELHPAILQRNLENMFYFDELNYKYKKSRLPKSRVFFATVYSHNRQEFDK